MYAGAVMYLISGIVGLVSLATGSAAVTGVLPAAGWRRPARCSCAGE
jgi:hypothetical protein